MSDHLNNDDRTQEPRRRGNDNDSPRRGGRGDREFRSPAAAAGGADAHRERRPNKGRAGGERGGYRGRPDGERGSYRGRADGERAGYGGGREERPYRGRQDGERGGYRGGREERPYRGRPDGERGGYRGRADGERAGYGGDREERPYRGRPDGERRPYRGRDDRTGGRPGHDRRGGRGGPGGRRFEDRDRGSFVPREDRPREPFLSEDITPDQLDKMARKPLRSLSKDNADRVARHLVAAGMLIDLDPELSYEHTQAAVRRAGRIDVVREAAALAAYATGRYGEALRELRTVRRLSGVDAHRAIEADCERGLGRPERALVVVAETDLRTLTQEQAVELAIVASGARADLGEREAALLALDAPHLDRVTDPVARRRLAEVRADRLEEAGRADEAEQLRANLPALPPEPEQDVVVYDTAVLPLPQEEAGDATAAEETGATEDASPGQADESEDGTEAGPEPAPESRTGTADARDNGTSAAEDDQAAGTGGVAADDDRADDDRADGDRTDDDHPTTGRPADDRADANVDPTDHQDTAQYTEHDDEETHR